MSAENPRFRGPVASRSPLRQALQSLSSATSRGSIPFVIIQDAVEYPWSSLLLEQAGRKGGRWPDQPTGRPAH